MEKDKEVELKIRNKIAQLVKKVEGVPEEFIPQLNVSNDFASPYIDIGFGGAVYLVVRERGVEYERTYYPEVDLLIKEVFKRIAFQLAVRDEAEQRKNEADYSFDKIEKLQLDYLNKFDLE
ncbi:hypothetical protein [Myroides odoratus]|nr:hypothetical protein [Myroides odoratus]QQU04325.1 hypothetical protein I6I89_03310 [Myroides odoratus]